MTILVCSTCGGRYKARVLPCPHCTVIVRDDPRVKRLPTKKPHMRTIQEETK